LIYTAIHADIYSNQLWTLFGYSTYSSNNIVYCNTLLWLYICKIYLAKRHRPRHKSRQQKIINYYFDFTNCSWLSNNWNHDQY